MQNHFIPVLESFDAYIVDDLPVSFASEDRNVMATVAQNHAHKVVWSPLEVASLEHRVLIGYNFRQRNISAQESVSMWHLRACDGSKFTPAQVKVQNLWSVVQSEELLLHVVSLLVGSG